MSRGSRQPHSGVIDLTAHRTAAILFKKRLFPLERAHQRRLERTAPNRLRRRGPPERHAAIRKPAGETNGARRILAAVPRPSTGSPTALRQHPVRHALVAKCLAPCAPHPGATSDPSPPQGREPRRHAQGLARYCDPIRQMQHLPCDLHRSSRHLLLCSRSPKPSRTR